MSEPVVVRPVKTKADYKTFLTFPWLLYQNDPYWVPPLFSMQKHKFDRAHNPSWKYMEGDYFLAWRGNKPVGTIAAFINHRHNEIRHEHIGFFGAFEVYEDQEAAAALLNCAAAYVQGKGYDVLRGPATFSTNEECGLLIQGFDDSPAILMPYNPPYYQTFIENTLGFAQRMDMYSYSFVLPDFQGSKKLEQSFRVTRKNNERRHITVRTPKNGREIRREFRNLQQIYNRAWIDNWGFVPLSEIEIEDVAKQLSQFLEPRLAFFADVDGKPAGFLMGIPDMNQPLSRAYPRPGKPEPLSLLHVFWHWKLRPKINRIRIALMGVDPEFQNI